MNAAGRRPINLKGLARFRFRIVRAARLNLGFQERKRLRNRSQTHSLFEVEFLEI